jgi:hypothetical protein
MWTKTPKNRHFDRKNCKIAALFVGNRSIFRIGEGFFCLSTSEKSIPMMVPVENVRHKEVLSSLTIKISARDHRAHKR